LTATAAGGGAPNPPPPDLDLGAFASATGGALREQRSAECRKDVDEKAIVLVAAATKTMAAIVAFSRDGRRQTRDERRGSTHHG
jgi:hypothetical protein